MFAAMFAAMTSNKSKEVNKIKDSDKNKPTQYIPSKKEMDDFTVCMKRYKLSSDYGFGKYAKCDKLHPMYIKHLRSTGLDVKNKGSHTIISYDATLLV